MYSRMLLHKEMTPLSLHSIFPALDLSLSTLVTFSLGHELLDEGLFVTVGSREDGRVSTSSTFSLLPSLTPSQHPLPSLKT